MMSMGPCSYNPYWTGIQPGMQAFVPPYGGPMPYMGGFGHMDPSLGGVLPPDPLAGPGFMLPYGSPQRYNSVYLLLASLSLSHAHIL